MMTHWLISLPLTCASTLHAYMMTDKPRLEAAWNKLISLAEEHGYEVSPLVVVVATPLSGNGVEAVRGMLAVEYPEAKERWEKASEFHFTTWVMPDDDPRDKALMADLSQHGQRLKAMRILGEPMRSQS
jgi:hypothetical protein